MRRGYALLFWGGFTAITLALQAWPHAVAALTFNRDVYNHGAWWQLLSAQWVHLSWGHAVGSVVALGAIAGGLHRWVPLRWQLLFLGCGYVGVAVVIALDGACLFYAGASGALHGLLVGNAVVLALAKKNAPRFLARCILLVIAVKLWAETQQFLFWQESYSFPVYHPAHLGGTLAGCLAALMLVLGLRRFATHSNPRNQT